MLVADVIVFYILIDKRWATASTDPTCRKFGNSATSVISVIFFIQILCQKKGRRKK